MLSVAAGDETAAKVCAQTKFPTPTAGPCVPPKVAGNQHTVGMKGNTFSPKELAIAAGDTVLFKTTSNHDVTEVTLDTCGEQVPFEVMDSDQIESTTVRQTLGDVYTHQQ